MNRIPLKSKKERGKDRRYKGLKRYTEKDSIQEKKVKFKKLRQEQNEERMIA